MSVFGLCVVYGWESIVVVWIACCLFIVLWWVERLVVGGKVWKLVESLVVG